MSRLSDEHEIPYDLCAVSEPYESALQEFTAGAYEPKSVTPFDQHGRVLTELGEPGGVRVQIEPRDDPALSRAFEDASALDGAFLGEYHWRCLSPPEGGQPGDAPILFRLEMVLVLPERTVLRLLFPLRTMADVTALGVLSQTGMLHLVTDEFPNTEIPAYVPYPDLEGQLLRLANAGFFGDIRQ